MYIELQQATKKYKTKEVETLALDGLSLSIEKGEMTAIMGTSGSGKTTLLNILGAMDRLTEGKYIFDGEEVSSYNQKALHQFRKEKMGFIFQNFELMSRYNVYENVEMPLLVRNVKDRKKVVLARLSELGIEELKNKFPSQLSGGQKQRVAIARALAADTEVILADEPTGALDHNTGVHVIELLKEINRNGKTVLVVTHDRGIAESCGRIIKIEDGKVVE